MYNHFALLLTSCSDLIVRLNAITTCAKQIRISTENDASSFGDSRDALYVSVYGDSQQMNYLSNK